MHRKEPFWFEVTILQSFWPFLGISTPVARLIMTFRRHIYYELTYQKKSKETSLHKTQRSQAF